MRLVSSYALRTTYSHQLLVQLAHRLRDDLDFADDAHEIHVAGPAGNDVLVQVPGDSGAGDPAEVDADVKALGAVRRDGAASLLPRFAL